MDPSVAGADGVLIIRPVIINLEVTAPELMTAGRQRNQAASAGQMTPYMELIDGVTGDVLYRVIDPKAAGDDIWRVRNAVTNRADADRVLRKSAELINSHVKSVKGGQAVALWRAASHWSVPFMRAHVIPAFAGMRSLRREEDLAPAMRPAPRRWDDMLSRICGPLALYSSGVM